MKMENKELLKNFVPMSEEEQKDLLFAVLDCMDFYDQKMNEAKSDAKKRQIYETYSAYGFISSFFLCPEWQKEANFKGYEVNRKNAKRQRKEYEKKWAKA